MESKKVECPICKKLYSKSNINKHLEWHKRNPDKLYRKEYVSLNHDGLNCQYCGKLCKSRNSLAQHEIRCKENPNKLILNNGGAWNKGLTKETNESVKQYSQKLKQKYDQGYINAQKGKPGTFKGKHHTEESKEKIRKSAIDRELGGWNRRNQIVYKDIKLGSSYEVAVAEELEKHNVKWLRSSYLIYKDNKGKEHRYYPDFYLPDYNVYLDPKNDYLLSSINKNFGYTDLQKIKWVEEQNNVRVIVLNKDNLNWESIQYILYK